MKHRDALCRFYDSFEQLRAGQAGGLRLSACHGKLSWPQRGLYFFLEDDEHRSTSGEGARVVRVGTHAVSVGARTSLWSRLSAHRGPRSGLGHHRGSIFRLIVGEALKQQGGLQAPGWGVGASRAEAARRLDCAPGVIAAQDAPVEARVSEHLGAMRVVVLAVDDAPGPGSLRAYLERNIIALLSGFRHEAADPPSPKWLGLASPRDRVARSGLWNQNHVDLDYDPHVLEVFRQHVEASSP